MIKDSNKIKILSASAVALIALSGTAYGTGVLEGDSENESYTDSEIVEQSQDLEVNETEQEDVTDGELDNTDEQEEVQDEQETEEVSQGDEGEPEGEEGEQADSGAEEQEDVEEEVEEDEEEYEEVDETKVVPHEDLPIDEETGLLDFPEYHKIANGRALPRPLTEEEDEFFQKNVIEGQYEEIRTSVTEVEYNYIYLYPREFYTEGDTLKYHKYVEIISELLTLDEQQDFLDYQEEYKKMSEEVGQVYDEEKGEYVDSGELDADYTIDIGFDDVGGTEGGSFEDENPVFEDNPIQNKYYEEKPILDNLGDYNDMTPEEFKEAYGFNFLFRAVVEEGGLYQEERELEDGLTLVIEAESLKTGKDGSEDTIVLRWGVVEEVHRINETLENVYIEGQYNLVTNHNSENYVESKTNPGVGNVVATGDATLRKEGRYTPQRVTVEYIDGEQVPNVYMIVADAIHVGDEQPLHSDIVGFIEYGIELGDLDDDFHFDNDIGLEEAPEEDGLWEDTEDTDDSTDPETGGSDRDETDPETSGGSGGETEVTDEEEGSGNTGGSREDGQRETETDTEEDEDLEESETGKETTSERFQQTGTSIVWGSILAGLGLSGVGAYFYKKSKKGKEEGDDEDE